MLNTDFDNSIFSYPETITPGVEGTYTVQLIDNQGDPLTGSDGLSYYLKVDSKCLLDTNKECIPISDAYIGEFPKIIKMTDNNDGTHSVDYTFSDTFSGGEEFTISAGYT